VKVRSKQPGIKVSHNGPVSFKYGFETDPIEMPEEHAKILLKNPTFERVNTKKKEA